VDVRRIAAVKTLELQTAFFAKQNDPDVAESAASTRWI
jgi:hypothetical protein